MGSVYERMVGVVKQALRKSLGKVNLKMDQLYTLLTEIEAVVNTHPLVYVTSDKVARTLSPADFLHYHVSLALPPLFTDPASAEDRDYQSPVARSLTLNTLSLSGMKVRSILMFPGGFG